MSGPVLLFGEIDRAILTTPEVGGGDDGAPVVMRVRSNRVAPEGPGGEALFEAIILTVRHQAALALTLRAYVDDVLVQTTPLTLPAQPSLRSRTLEVRLSVPVVVGTVERGRLRPRGAWLQVELESVGIAPFAVDGCDVEFTGVRRRG